MVKSVQELKKDNLIDEVKELELTLLERLINEIRKSRWR